MRLTVLGSTTLAALLLASRASADCPGTAPADPACEPIVSLFMPSVAAAAYFPRDAKGPYLGGGLEIGFLSWSSNNEGFGPSQGRFRGSFEVLASPHDERVFLYRFGAVVSFEGNASRRFFIPTFGAAIGGIWQSETGARPAADASLGLYIVYTRRFVLDAEAGAVLPFTSVDSMIGPRAQLTAAFSLW